MTCTPRGRCEQCERVFHVWFTNNWVEVSPKETYLRIDCFLKEADKKGINAIWTLTKERDI